MPIKVLVSPYPKKSGGPSISIRRVLKVLSQTNKISWSGRLYKWFGVGTWWYDIIWMINTPRFFKRILKGNRPVIVRLGIFRIKEWCITTKNEYLPIYEKQKKDMLHAVQKADRTVFQSAWVKENYEKEIDTGLYGDFNKSKWDVINNGVDLTVFKPPAIRSTNFTIGTSGRFIYRFRLDTLFKVSRLLSFEHQLLIVGKINAECQHVLQEYLQEPLLKKKTIWLGNLAPEQLPAVYHKMHCLFHPVSGDACPNVTAEAMASGVPVVAPEFGGAKDYVHKGGVLIKHATWLYDDSFCEKMADAINEIYMNYDCYSRTARRIAEEKLEIGILAKHWLNNFQQAVYTKNID